MSESEKRINNSLKRIRKKFPQYKLVDNLDDGDIVVTYFINDTQKFGVSIINSSIKEKIINERDENIIHYYLRHKNQRNKKQLIIGDVERNHFMLQD